MDGYITIGTKLDTSDLDKELKAEEKELQQYEKKQSELLETKAKIKLDTSDIVRLQKELEVAKKKYESIKQMEVPGAALTDYSEKVKDTEKALQDANIRFNEQRDLLHQINGQLEENQRNINITKDNIKDINKDIRNELQLQNINEKVENVGTSISGVVKKVGRWALAMFGIRGVLGFISSSMSTLSQHNEQMATDIDYIRYALASTMQPLIERMIDLVYKLLAYTNYIAKAWFNVDLFTNASVNNFNKANKSAKELKNTLQSFDEMEVVGDSDKGGGIKTPSFDLSKGLGDVEIPEWVKWIAEHKDDIFKIAEIIGGLFIASQIAKWTGNIMGFINGPLALFGTTLGSLALIAGGIIITALCAKQVWDDTKRLKNDLDEINKKIDDHYDTQTEHYDNITDDNERINQMLTDEGIKIRNQNDMLGNATGFWGKILGLSKEELENLKQNIISNKKIYDQLIDQYNQGNMSNEQKEQYKKKLEQQIELNKKTTDELKRQGFNTQEIEDYTKDLEIQLYAVNKGIEYSGEETEGWKQSTEGVKEELDNINATPLDNKELQVSVNESGWQKFTKKVANWFKEVFDIGVTFNYEGSSGGWHSSGGGHFAKGGIVSTRLASGGAIINNPGRGVPVGSAIGGERGMEAVIPLTDSQQMALLGEAIGKYITINANIVNTMNGRVISRELKKVETSNDFAFNR